MKRQPKNIGRRIFVLSHSLCFWPRKLGIVSIRKSSKCSSMPARCQRNINPLMPCFHFPKFRKITNPREQSYYNISRKFGGLWKLREFWKLYPCIYHYQFSSVSQSCPNLYDPMNHSTPDLLVHHQLPGFIQTHVHRVSDTIQPSQPLSSPSPPAPNPSRHQGLFQWVNSSHQVAKELEFQLQHQSFQWIFRTDFL